MSRLLLVIVILGSAHGVASAFSSVVYVPTASIDRLDYPSHVVVDEPFEVTVSMHYYMPSGYSIHLEIAARNGYLVPGFTDEPIEWDSWDVPPLSNEGNIVKTFDVSISARLINPGRMALGAIAYYCPSGGGYCSADLARRDFEIDVASGPPIVDILDIQYVKPPDTIAKGEATPVVVKTKYSNLYDTTSLTMDVYDLNTGSHVAGQDAPERFSGTGTYTFRPLSITPRESYPLGWSLRVEVTAESAEDMVAEAKKDIIISVEPAFGGVQITNVVVPPGTIAVDESFPVTVTAQYSDLAGGTKLMLWFKDQDTDEQLQVTTSSGPLSGSGTYTFKPVNPKAKSPGDWHLQALVDLAGDTVATKSFTMKVVGAPVAATIQITSVKIPPGTLKVGESAPVTVTIKYQNLAPGTKLTVYVQDEDAHKKLKSVTSIALSGSGTYTFPNIIIKPTKAGTWHLSAGITDHPETRTLFTITVVQ